MLRGVMEEHIVDLGMPLQDRDERRHNVAERRHVNVLRIEDRRRHRAVPDRIVVRRDGLDRKAAAGLLCREAEERNAHADLARFARGAERIGHARKRLAAHAAAVIADRHPEFAVRVLEAIRYYDSK